MEFGRGKGSLLSLYFYNGSERISLVTRQTINTVNKLIILYIFLDGEKKNCPRAHAGQKTVPPQVSEAVVFIFIHKTPKNALNHLIF